MTKNIEYYMSLPYKKNIYKLDIFDGGGYLAEIPDLGVCATCAWGAIEEEALHNVKLVMKSNIEMWLKEGLAIPEPIK